MILIGLLLMPLLLAVIGLAVGKGKITGKEFAVHIGVVVLIVIVGYVAGRAFHMRDTELWSGRITNKWKAREGCCHSYRCRCKKDKDGRELCDTCYKHRSDDAWYAKTSNNETVFSDTCNAPGSAPPDRWTAIRVGEPTAFKHGFDNYIKAAGDSVLLRSGVPAHLTAAVPDYPSVYDRYRADRVLPVGVTMRNAATLNAELMEVNAVFNQQADVESRKQVNIIMIVTSEADAMFAEAIRERWYGGKKNDFIVIIGAPHYPNIAWVDTVSWTKVEALAVAVRNRILALTTLQDPSRDAFADGTAALAIIREEVAAKWIRTPMADFAYLRATIEPPAWILWSLFALGLAVSIGLQVYFWQHDPFGSGFTRSRRYGRY